MTANRDDVINSFIKDTLPTLDLGRLGDFELGYQHKLEVRCHGDAFLEAADT